MIGSFIASGPRAVQAWAASVNAHGGLDCHKIDYLIADDGGDPARNQSLTQQMVEDHGVIAFVHNDAPIGGAGSVAYLTSKHIPAIGSESGSPWFYEGPSYFPQASSGPLVFSAAMGAASVAVKAKGLTRVGTMSCIEAPICSSLYQTGSNDAANFGLKLVSRYQGSLVQPDFSAPCQSARDAGAQILLTAFDPNSLARIARNCKAIGLQPVFATGGPVANDSVLQVPELNGLVVGSVVAPPLRGISASVDEFLDTMAKYAPGVTPDNAAMLGWASAKLFEAAALHGLSQTPTSADLFAGLYAYQGDLGGLTQPLQFSPGQKAAKRLCFYVSQVENGKYVSPNHGQRVCL